MLATSQLSAAQNPKAMSDSAIKDYIARAIDGIKQDPKVYLLDGNFQPIFFPDPNAPGTSTCELTRTDAVVHSAITNNSAQDVHAQCTLVLKEVPGLAIHALVDHVAITYCYFDPDGSLALEIPQGIFGFQIPDRKLNIIPEQTFTGYEPTFDLTLLKFSHGYTIPADAQVVAACQTIMMADMTAVSEGGRQPSGVATGTCPSRNSPIVITVPAPVPASSPNAPVANGPIDANGNPLPFVNTDIYSAPVGATYNLGGYPHYEDGAGTIYNVYPGVGGGVGPTQNTVWYAATGTSTPPSGAAALPPHYVDPYSGALYGATPAEYMGPGAPGSGILGIWSGTSGTATPASQGTGTSYTLPVWPDNANPGSTSGGCDMSGANIPASRILADPSTQTMGIDTELDDKVASQLAGINQLLTVISYRKLYYDHTQGPPIPGIPTVPIGQYRLQSDPLALGQTPAPEWVLSTLNRQAMQQGVGVSISNQAAIVNKITLIAQNTAGDPIIVTARNTSTDSATSVTNWGKVSESVVRNDKIIDVTTAQIVAFDALNEGSRGTFTVNLTCALLPTLTPHSQLDLQIWTDDGVTQMVNGSTFPLEVSSYSHDFSTRLTTLTAAKSAGL